MLSSMCAEYFLSSLCNHLFLLPVVDAFMDFANEYVYLAVVDHK